MAKEYSFEGQRRGERVRAVVKNHPLVLFVPAAKTAIFWLMAAVVVIYWPNQYAALLAFLLAIIGLGIISRHWFIYSQSYFIISSERVINIDQRGFFARKIIETELKNIQDVSSHTEGALKTLAKFGNLVIRTSGAAQGSEIIVKNIPHPYEVQQLIVNKSTK